MSDIDKPDIPNVTLTIRMIMNGKEVGSIIGKGGEIINNIREESGARIHITDGSVPERIVTVTGSTESILKAFTMICKKFEDDGPREGSSNVPRPPVTLRLIVPASQCGSLIGKGGSKIKEIREVSGASIQVASEMLPNSTERAVTVSGTKDAITECIHHVCLVMLDSPAKGTPVPYTPKGGAGMGGGPYMPGRSGRGSGGGGQENPLANLLGLGSGGASTLAALATLAGSQIRDHHHHRGRDGSRDGSTQTFEMSIPNDLIGCIIGKGGSKIAEIRQISGAMIRISKSEEGKEDSSERQINISGNADSVALAKSLINMSLDIHKSKMEERDKDGGNSSSNGRDSGSSSSSSSRRYNNYNEGSGSGLAHLLSKPEALTTALTTLASFGQLGGLGSSLLGGMGNGGHGGGMGYGMVTGVHRSRGGYGGGSRGNRDDDRGSRDSKRSKFAPY